MQGLQIGNTDVITVGALVRQVGTRSLSRCGECVAVEDGKIVVAWINGVESRPLPIGSFRRVITPDLRREITRMMAVTRTN